ncbi:hypothetical protein KDH_80180 [Dictyobacter sp. S3.2.2.5]|uniref:Uncharacterized protein n=1 Tax=Dictyobacter halimunensis TaxID=3026934 RepID=A0ABQ6G3S8_9CHLR|nr:hypothetical protein KDH_80180 [Dictyobacter sp. S3.2.2.5]
MCVLDIKIGIDRWVGDVASVLFLIKSAAVRWLVLFTIVIRPEIKAGGNV